MGEDALVNGIATGIEDVAIGAAAAADEDGGEDGAGKVVDPDVAEVAGRCDRAVTSDWHIVDNDNVSINAGNLHIHSIVSKAHWVSEEVVSSSCSRLSGRSSIGADVEAGDSFVRVDDWHA